MKTVKKIWKVQGIVFTDKPQKYIGMRRKRFVVRYMQDNEGTSLSIADEASGVMYLVPFADIQKEISEEKIL